MPFAAPIMNSILCANSLALVWSSLISPVTKIWPHMCLRPPPPARNKHLKTTKNISKDFYCLKKIGPLTSLLSNLNVKRFRNSTRHYIKLNTKGFFHHRSCSSSWTCERARPGSSIGQALWSYPCSYVMTNWQKQKHKKNTETKVVWHIITLKIFSIRMWHKIEIIRT